MARHLSYLNIDTFRGIMDLELKDLGDVNILVGANNSGKTSVLEAIMLLGAPDDFSNILGISRLREGNRISPRFGISFYDSFIYLFNRLSEEMLINVSCEIDDQKVFLRLEGRIEKVLVDLNEVMRNSFVARNKNSDEPLNDSEEIDSFIGEIQFGKGKLQLDLSSNTIPVNFNKYDRSMRMERKVPFLKVPFISTIDHIVKNNFREIVRNKKLNSSVVEVLNLFDPCISDLRIIQEEDGRINQVIDNVILDYMPLSTYGDGIKKIIALANGIAEAKNGVLLVDEIETSIHASVLKKVFSWLINACKEFNVQMFLTTHSLETVDAIINCDESFIGEDLIRVITLVKKENQTIARVLTGEKALQVRDDYDMELRS